MVTSTAMGMNVQPGMGHKRSGGAKRRRRNVKGGPPMSAPQTRFHSLANSVVLRFSFQTFLDFVFLPSTAIIKWNHQIGSSDFVSWWILNYLVQEEGKGSAQMATPTLGCAKRKERDSLQERKGTWGDRELETAPEVGARGGRQRAGWRKESEGWYQVRS